MEELVYEEKDMIQIIEGTLQLVLNCKEDLYVWEENENTRKSFER